MSIRARSLIEITRFTDIEIINNLHKHLNVEAYEDIEYELQRDRDTIGKLSNTVRDVICERLSQAVKKLGGFVARSEIH